MRLFCLVSYYDEPNLHKAVSDALDCGCTDVILLDGAYKHYPHLKPTSPEEQAEAVAALCADRGIPLIQTAVVGATEAEKRTLLFDLAYQAGATIGTDWLFVQDGDHTIAGAIDLKPLLAKATEDVFDTMVIEHDNTRWDDFTCRRWVRQTFRVVEGMHVDPEAHWIYKDAKGRRLWAYNSIPSNGDLPIVIHNDSTGRGHKRNKARNRYYTTRAAENVEQHLPPDGCYYCDGPATHPIATDWKYGQEADGTWSVSHRRQIWTCDQHLHRVQARNTYEIQMQRSRLIKDNPAFAAQYDAFFMAEIARLDRLARAHPLAQP